MVRADSITADIITGSLVRNPNRSYKSYLTYFIPPLRNAKEHFRNARMQHLKFPTPEDFTRILE